MVRNRKNRNTIQSSNIADINKPFDIELYGSEDDPCFGKLYDLKAHECQVCGDSEFCSIVMAQNLKIATKTMEKEQRFKDVEEAERASNIKDDNTRELIAKYIAKGLRKTKIIIKVSDELNIERDKVKQIYNTF